MGLIVLLCLLLSGKDSNKFDAPSFREDANAREARWANASCFAG